MLRGASQQPPTATNPMLRPLHKQRRLGMNHEPAVALHCLLLAGRQLQLDSVHARYDGIPPVQPAPPPSPYCEL